MGGKGLNIPIITSLDGIRNLARNKYQLITLILTPDINWARKIDNQHNLKKKNCAKIFQ